MLKVVSVDGVDFSHLDKYLPEDQYIDAGADGIKKMAKEYEFEISDVKEALKLIKDGGVFRGAIPRSELRYKNGKWVGHADEDPFILSGDSEAASWLISGDDAGYMLDCIKEATAKKLNLEIDSCGECPYCISKDDPDTYRPLIFYCDHRSHLTRMLIFKFEGNTIMAEELKNLPDWCPLENNV